MNYLAKPLKIGDRYLDKTDWSGVILLMGQENRRVHAF